MPSKHYKEYWWYEKIFYKLSDFTCSIILPGGKHYFKDQCNNEWLRFFINSFPHIFKVGQQAFISFIEREKKLNSLLQTCPKADMTVARQDFTQASLPLGSELLAPGYQ